MTHASLIKNTKIKAPFEIKFIEQEGIFSGYASVFNDLDEQGDRVLKGAFQASLAKCHYKKQMPKMLWQHDSEQPIGIWHMIREDQKGLYVEGQLLLDVQRGREAYALLKAGVLDSLSIGYQVVEAEKGGTTGERKLKKVDLFEISLVTFPANTAARITRVKNRGGDFTSLIEKLNRATETLKGEA